MYLCRRSERRTNKKRNHCYLKRYRILLLKFLFIPDNGTSISQFESDNNYFIAMGVFDEVVTVFIT